jgi:hypothetical protein
MLKPAKIIVTIFFNSIIEQRARLAKRLRKSLGLKSDLDDVIAEAYEDALELAVKETQLPSTFPTQCPYTIKQLLDDDFYPEHI